MNAISSELRSALGERKAPIVLDMRRPPAYREARETISGALRRDPEGMDKWIGTLPRASSVVVYCAHGREVSQNVAKALDRHGIQARYLEGGIEAWEGTVSLGLSRIFPDDHEMLRYGMVLYDALYAWCKEGQDEVHTWN